MSYPIMILGESGTGKTTSLRNLDPAQCTLIQAVKKPLPFRSKGFVRFAKDANGNANGGNVFVTDDDERITRIMYGCSTPIVIIDDFQYVMANEFMRRTSEKGFDKFTEIAKHAHGIIQAAAQAPGVKRIYIMAHTDTGDDGITRIKTIGKLLNEKITLEGMLTMVLRTHVEGGQYQFSTRNNGRDTVKSPLGMFDSDYIDNDLAAVDKAVCDFYAIQPDHQEQAA